MKIRFKLNAETAWGQEVCLSGSSKELGEWDEHKALNMSCLDIGVWEIEVDIKLVKNTTYKYFIKDGSANNHEYGVNRLMELEASKNVLINDTWRYADSPDNNLLSSPFSKAFFIRKSISQKNDVSKIVNKSDTILRLQIRAPRVGKDYTVGVLGSTDFLGEWKEDKVVLLDDQNYPEWAVDIPIKSATESIEYKYVIVHSATGKIVTWDQQNNRRIHLDNKVNRQSLIIQSDEYFIYPVGSWKAAGIAIPVFSIRTNESAGVGEFTDILKMVDWAAKIKMKVLQVLPVNDTIATQTWKDSYPYAAISVHALHPIYASMKAIGDLKDQSLQKELNKEAERLNSLPDLDYEAVLKLKSKFFKYSFDENKLKVLISKELKLFMATNESWITAYAVFSYLRDKFKTPDFNQWGEYASMDNATLLKFAAPNQPQFDDIAVHYYIQFHLDKQLREATEYARQKGVVLKGDIPIGIFRSSVDAWRWPHLFHMDCQTGAPPDDFSITGQNWGFPTYNWEAMAKENYNWWKSRMTKMSEYFDVFRIDHILGFFRIWEMPEHAVQGIQGQFNPSLPYHVSELEASGIHFDYNRMCKPFIPAQMIHDLFGSNWEWIFNNVLKELSPGWMELNEEFNTQKKIEKYLELEMVKHPEKSDFFESLRHSLYRLPTEILFLEAPIGDNCYNPRIALYSTYSYQWLNEDQKTKIDRLYNHYFYHRHNDFWRESAMAKLPMLSDATDMLICGEDLGMVPACVPGVMKELQILSLAVQRMPNDDREFWHPSDIPYMYVTTTGSHDVSNLREWWLENRADTQSFYNNILGFQGAAPEQCEAWVAHQIIKQHLYSPAMLSIFPIQDILAMSDKLKRENCLEERINIPAIIPHNWKYRLHLKVEDLLNAEDFNESMSALVDSCGRYADY
ncbi:MAG: 4-alpha-glucanotransferase [Cyclobacteriaceae bacterium]|jgi:4-alpha-glucanotransferase